MASLIERCIGRECMITTLQGNCVGRVESVENNWVLLKKGNENEIVNLDFICKVKPLPIKNPIISVEDFVVD